MKIENVVRRLRRALQRKDQYLHTSTPRERSSLGGRWNVSDDRNIVIDYFNEDGLLLLAKKMGVL